MNNREIDALIAENVMVEKLKYVQWGDWSCALSDTAVNADSVPLLARLINGHNNIAHCEVPRYTEGIASAWLVVEIMREREFSVSMGSWENSCDANRWFCEFEADDELQRHCVPAPTLPLAICLAALKAMGVEMGS